jgi:hypothetical protein
MKNIFALQITKRMVYEAPKAEAMDSYKAFQAEIGNAERAEGTVDSAKAGIAAKCDAAVGDHGSKTKDEMDRLDKEAKDKVAAFRAEIGTAPADRKSAEYKDWETKKNAKEAEIKRTEKESADKKAAAWREHEAVKARIYAMSTQAQTRVAAAYAAKAAAEKQAQKEIDEGVNSGKVDPDIKKEWGKRASFAQDLADDGNLSSWGGEVQDYHDTDYTDKNGDKKTLNDKDLETMTMGIAAVLHNPDSAKKEDDPARAFMQGLSNKEAASGSFWNPTDDRGVDMNDVQLQILQGLGKDTKDRYARDSARKSPEGALVNDIARDDKLPPALRGMMLGHLAQAGKDPKEIAKRMEEVRSMYANVQRVGGQTRDAVGGPEVFYGGPLAMLMGFGLVAQGYSDENKLERAGAIFEMLKDMEIAKRFGAQAARYEQVKALAGKDFKDEAVEKIIAEANGNLGYMRDNEGKLSVAVSAAEGKAKETQIKLVKEGDAYKKAKELYTYFGAEFPYDAQIDGLKGKPLSDLMPGIAEITTRMASAGDDPALRAQADKAKTQCADKFKTIRAYQEKYNKNAGKAEVKALPAIAGQYPDAITAADPVLIREEIRKNKTMEDDVKEANMAALDAAIASSAAKAKSGGGGGAVAGGSGGSGGGPAVGPRTGAETGDGVKVTGMQVGSTELISSYGVDPASDKAKPESRPPTWAKQQTGDIAQGKYQSTGQYYTQYEVRRGNEVYIAHVGSETGGATKVEYYKAPKAPPQPPKAAG